MQAFHLQLCGSDSYCLDGLYLLSLPERSFGAIWAALEPALADLFLQQPPDRAAEACKRFCALQTQLGTRDDFEVHTTIEAHLARCQALGANPLATRTGLVARSRKRLGWSVEAYRITPGFEARPFDAPQSTHPAWRLNTSLVGHPERWCYVQLREGWVAEIELEPRRDSDGSASVCATWHAYHRARPELPEIHHELLCASDDMTQAYRLVMSDAVQRQCEALARTIEQGL